ncbi:MAG: hypothetical protein E6G48_09490 [Actinobacteria bacterium]|nr:MAG: hypothetical protein E6G48_09490 [Actinomycetota bacterium]
MERADAAIALEASDLAPVDGGVPARYLGRLGLTALCVELDQAGVTEALRARGYVDLGVRIEAEGSEHRLLVSPAGSGESLIDLRMAEDGSPSRIRAPSSRASGRGCPDRRIPASAWAASSTRASWAGRPSGARTRS